MAAASPAGRAAYRFAISLLAVAYARTGREDEGRALIAAFRERTPGLTMERIKRDFPPRNPTVASPRRRIAAVLRGLGVPERPHRLGRVH